MLVDRMTEAEAYYLQHYYASSFRAARRHADAPELPARPMFGHEVPDAGWDYPLTPSNRYLMQQYYAPLYPGGVRGVHYAGMTPDAHVVPAPVHHHHHHHVPPPPRLLTAEAPGATRRHLHLPLDGPSQSSVGVGGGGSGGRNVGTRPISRSYELEFMYGGDGESSESAEDYDFSDSEANEDAHVKEVLRSIRAQQHMEQEKAVNKASGSTPAAELKEKCSCAKKKDDDEDLPPTFRWVEIEIV